MNDMTKTEMGAMLRKRDNKSFVELREAVDEETHRRAQIIDLTEEINEKLYELSGLLTEWDSLRVLNNLTGEVMTAIEDWEEPNDDEYYLAPKIVVELAVVGERKPRCPGAPANCHECDGCPWD